MASLDWAVSEVCWLSQDWQTEISGERERAGALSCRVWLLVTASSSSWRPLGEGGEGRPPGPVNITVSILCSLLARQDTTSLHDTPEKTEAVDRELFQCLNTPGSIYGCVGGGRR